MKLKKIFVFFFSLIFLFSAFPLNVLSYNFTISNNFGGSWSVYYEDVHESKYRFYFGRNVSGVEFSLYVFCSGNDVNGDYIRFTFVGENIDGSLEAKIVGVARVGYDNDNKVSVGKGRHLIYYVLPQKNYVSYVNITLHSRSSYPKLDLQHSTIKEWDPIVHYVPIIVWTQGWAAHDLTSVGRGRIAVLSSGANFPPGCPQESGIVYVFGKGFKPPNIIGNPDVYVDFSYVGGFNAAPESFAGKGNYRCKIDVGVGAGLTLNEACYSGLNQTLYLNQKYTTGTVIPLIAQDTAKGTIDIFLEVGKKVLESPIAKKVLDVLGYISFAYDITQMILSLGFDEIATDAKILVWHNVNIDPNKKFYTYFNIICQTKSAGLTGTIANFYGECPWGRPLLEGLFGTRIFELPSGGMFVGGILLHYYLPVLENISPLQDNMPVTSKITLKFTKPLDRGSIVKNVDSIIATANSKPIDFFDFFHFRDSGSDQTVLVMSPNYHLDYDTIYVINFTSKILDIEGFQLEPFTLTFKTEAGPPKPKNVYYNVSLAVSQGFYEFGGRMRGDIYKAIITKDPVIFDFKNVVADAVFRTNDPLLDYWNEGSGWIFRVGDKIYLKLSTAKDGGIPPRSKIIFELVERLEIKTGVWAKAKVKEFRVGNPTLANAISQQAGVKSDAIFNLEPIVLKEYSAIGERIGSVTFYNSGINFLDGKTLQLYAIVRDNIVGIIPDKPESAFIVNVGARRMPIDFVVYYIGSDFVGAWRLVPEYFGFKQNTYNFVINFKGSSLELFIFSNSTVSDFFYNGTKQTLSFKVSGRDGTYGYVNLMLPKDLGNIKPKIFFDGKEIKDFIMEKTDTGYRIYFTYIHSTHEIIIHIFGQEEVESQKDMIKYLPTITLSIIIIIFAILLYHYFLREKDNLSSKKTFILFVFK
ncbi:MAG: Ig-like domain-containing protein [Nitrososphaeria archaeon]|nr:Ig-like domain-containing protein [Nitrososphaeria archaeon]